MGRNLMNQSRDHFRCVGVGVGPANLSLASLLHGHEDVPNLFFEKKVAFGWHDGQMIPGATLQVSMVKDLVTLSDPTNRFSFLSYLHARRKIYHFLNAQFDEVPREEFRNYMEWASRENENVVFGEGVNSVEFDDRKTVFRIHTGSRTVTADNVVVGIGKEPNVPATARPQLGDTQFHVSEFMHKARGLGGKRVWVIGGGQSGAEAFLDLISRPAGELPRRVGWLSRRRNYFPLDDSPFTNDYYMPCYTAYFASLERTTREALNAEHVLTSDGISESTLREIYQRIYVHHFIDGATDLAALYPNRDVRSVTGDAASGWDITFAHNDHLDVAEHAEADVIIWATGYRSPNMEFLEPIEGRLAREESNRDREHPEYEIDQDFAVRWDGPANRNVFLQNAARRQRGLADSNLSLLAWRSQRIVDRLRGVRTDGQLESFLEWSTKSTVDKIRET
jgi:lysine N6-hydroxylase